MANIKPVTQMVTKQIVEACPGCGQPIWARLAVKVEILDSEDPANVVMKGNCIGLEVQHDCRPRVSRGGPKQNGETMPGQRGGEHDA